jgi:hypothetical protein
MEALKASLNNVKKPSQSAPLGKAAAAAEEPKVKKARK